MCFFVMIFCCELFPVFLFARKEVVLLFSECRLFVYVGNGEQSEFTVLFSRKKVVVSFHSGFHDHILDQEVDAISIFDLRLMCSRWTRPFARSSDLAFAVIGVVR